MNVKQSAIALAITAALPLAGQAAPKVSFVAPTSGGTISGVINQSSACEVRGSSDIRRVVFYADGKQLNTEGSAPWNCNIDTRQYADGTHTLRAVAYDARGASTTTQISVNIKNSTTSTSGPTVQFTAPAEGGALSGNVQGPPSCVVTGSNISRVMFYLNDVWTNTDGNLDNGLGCWIDTTRYQDGAYTVKAVAYDADGRTATATRSIKIQNTSTSTNTPPSVSFRAPASGATVKGTLSGSACEAAASDSNGIKQVQFFLDGAPLNTELSSPYNCSLDTTKFADGTHTLTAVGTDGAGATGSAQISLTIANDTTSTSGPTVQFTAPAEGGALSGNVQGPPNCIVTGANIARVMFYLNDTWTNTDGNLDNGLGCWIDTTKYADGAYTVKAVAYDAEGRTATATRAIVIKNAAATNASPTVSFKAPTAGSTLKGLVNSTTCEAAAADSDGTVSKVDFYVGATFVNSKAAAPWQCAVDTTKFADGPHTLMAVATDDKGASATTQVGVQIQNTDPSGGGSGGGTAISLADIVYSASADVPFSQQSGYSAQVIGTYTSAPSIPETGIHGTVLPNGESLRLGKSADPVDSARKALTFQLSPTDPNTSGSKRSEISFSPKIEHDKVYWVALSAYVHDWGTLSSSDSSVFGTQLHSGDNSRGLSPAFSIISNGGKDFQIYALYSTSSSPAQGNTTTTRSPRFALPFERWVDFVFKFKLNTSGQGFLQVWQDGTQIVDYKGSLGFNTPGYKDYMKFGYYNWSSALNSPRKVQLRSPVTVADPTGSKYKPEDLRGYLKAQP